MNFSHNDRVLVSKMQKIQIKASKTCKNLQISVNFNKIVNCYQKLECAVAHIGARTIVIVTASQGHTRTRLNRTSHIEIQTIYREYPNLFYIFLCKPFDSQRAFFWLSVQLFQFSALFSSFQLFQYLLYFTIFVYLNVRTSVWSSMPSWTNKRINQRLL